MPHCKNAQTPCTCGRLVLYDRTGRLVELAGHGHCPFDREANKALTAALQHWFSRHHALQTGNGHGMARPH